MGPDRRCPQETGPQTRGKGTVCNAADPLSVLRTSGAEFVMPTMSVARAYVLSFDTSHAPTEMAFASNR
jgi:hypothetical protein